MAQALTGMPGLQRAFVVHGANGWDEPTPIGPFTVFDVCEGRVRRGERTPADYGLATCKAAELAGGDADFNAAALARVLRGEDRGAHRDALLLGASLALECTGQITEPHAGIAVAAAAIDDGRAATVLQRMAEMRA